MAEKWGFYATLYHLAQGDVLRIDAVSNLGVRQAMTFLCYEIDLHILKNNQGMPHDTQ